MDPIVTLLNDERRSFVGSGHLHAKASRSDIAWAAGLFEGEGCFTACYQRKTGRRYLHAVLVSTDQDVLERFHRIVGVGKIYPKAPRRPEHKPCWRWQVTTEAGFRAVYELLAPQPLSPPLLPER